MSGGLSLEGGLAGTVVFSERAGRGEGERELTDYRGASDWTAALASFVVVSVRRSTPGLLLMLACLEGGGGVHSCLARPCRMTVCLGGDS